MKEAAAAAAAGSSLEAATSPVYVREKRKSKLERELILKHVLTGRNSYWGCHEDSDDDELDIFAAATTTTPKKAPGPPREQCQRTAQFQSLRRRRRHRPQ